MSGYQQSFVEIQPTPSQAPSNTQEQPSIEEPAPVKSASDSKEIPQPQIREIIKMSEKKSTGKRSVGVDIGTGFISCAEQEGGSKKFRKVRDAFFKLNPS